MLSFLRTVGGHPTEHGRQLKDIIRRLDTHGTSPEALVMLIIADLSLIANVELCAPDYGPDYSYTVRFGPSYRRLITVDESTGERI